MHNYAIVQIAGYQFRVEEGSRVTVPRLELLPSESFTVDKILMLNRDGAVTLGSPYIEGAKAEAKVLEHSRSKKVRVFKKKKRKGYRRSASARQYQTVIEISGLPAA